MTTTTSLMVRSRKKVGTQKSRKSKNFILYPGIDRLLLYSLFNRIIYKIKESLSNVCLVNNLLTIIYCNILSNLYIL